MHLTEGRFRLEIISMLMKLIKYGINCLNIVTQLNKHLLHVITNTTFRSLPRQYRHDWSNFCLEVDFLG